jgi:hypothetical protein
MRKHRRFCELLSTVGQALRVLFADPAKFLGLKCQLWPTRPRRLLQNKHGRTSIRRFLCTFCVLAEELLLPSTCWQREIIMGWQGIPQSSRAGCILHAHSVFHFVLTLSWILFDLNNFFGGLFPKCMKSKLYRFWKQRDIKKIWWRQRTSGVWGDKHPCILAMAARSDLIFSRVCFCHFFEFWDGLCQKILRIRD